MNEVFLPAPQSGPGRKADAARTRCCQPALGAPCATGLGVSLPGKGGHGAGALNLGTRGKLTKIQVSTHNNLVDAVLLSPWKHCLKERSKFDFRLG